MIAIGPHASTTPRAAIRKLASDAAILGEPEEILPKLGGAWETLDSFAWQCDGDIRLNGSPHASDMKTLPALRWPAESIARHRHHHHRFEAEPTGPGAEMEVSRGCPYHCTFCAKENFRTNYRKRPLETILDELDALIAQGIEYVYFIDEIFLPDKLLLEALMERRFKFGVQTRIDLWNEPMLELLGKAGCVSIEAGVESISEEGRALLDKKSRLSTPEFSERLIFAKRHVLFVQANLLDAKVDDAAEIEAWREHLHSHGVWANKPVPLFPYPGSPDYRRLWGLPDDLAWERALEYYLRQNSEFSDIQNAEPLSIEQLELGLE
jgi:B12-binding domain/radical SAM domain protein of rhizo-twelve system